MLNISPQYLESQSCLENNLYTIATWLGREYVLMHAKAWYFSFKPPHENDYGILGTRLNTGVHNSAKSLERYHGLQIKKFDGNTTELLPLLKKELAMGKPLLMCIDSQWLPWNPKYRVENAIRGNHYFMIVGWQEETQLFKCLDPHVPTRDELKDLSWDDLEQGNAKWIQFSIAGNRVAAINGMDILKEAADCLLTPQEHGRNSFEDMLAFADEVENRLDLEAEVKVLETDIFPKMIPLAHNFQYLAKGRVNFSNVLVYLGKHFNQTELLPMAQQVTEFAKEWDQILQLYAATIKVPSKDEQRRIIVESAEQIRGLCLAEKQVVSSMVALCSHAKGPNGIK